VIFSWWYNKPVFSSWMINHSVVGQLLRVSVPTIWMLTQIQHFAIIHQSHGEYCVWHWIRLTNFISEIRGEPMQFDRSKLNVHSWMFDPWFECLLMKFDPRVTLRREEKESHEKVLLFPPMIVITLGFDRLSMDQDTTVRFDRSFWKQVPFFNGSGRFAWLFRTVQRKWF
jgi:hypothetical protein